MVGSVCGILIPCHRGNLGLSCTPSRPRRCQGCGHHKRAVPHPEANKKKRKTVCNVPENERREPDISNRVRNRCDTIKVCPGEACTAYISRLPGEIC